MSLQPSKLVPLRSATNTQKVEVHQGMRGEWWTSRVSFPLDSGVLGDQIHSSHRPKVDRVKTVDF